MFMVFYVDLIEIHSLYVTFSTECILNEIQVKTTCVCSVVSALFISFADIHLH
jgi:hypothetical protein